MKSLKLVVAVGLISASMLGMTRAETQTVTIPSPRSASADGFKMGQSHCPDGTAIALDSRSLRLDDTPWTPVMGEFHFSRYPEDEWREELLKMKAGGIDIVATYVFWIHHEEVEGQFDWSGRRSLRKFIKIAGDVGLKAVVRCGPWCHGEVRNGGLPDWILQKGWRTRSDDANYLEKVRVLYGQIAAQLKGLLWKGGGPVIGIQLENEFRGPAQHLLSLKEIAREAGLDVPLYTRTGWPALRGPMPFGEIVPLYGAYAEGFWDRELTPMPGNYWTGFRFSSLRTDSAIATDQLGRRQARDAADVAAYPYLTCEMGGGMMNSYHRRILIYPKDIEATMLVKLGSGSTLPGYYMYHGGVNPEGKLTTLMESQATGYWNDMPVKNYDFQAPLGQYGQVRPHYHLLRRLHLFLRDFGSALAQMPAAMPNRQPRGRDDVTTLRWAVRSDGVGGLVFVNNYERLKPMPAKADVQFALMLPSESLTFPAEPVTVPADSCFFWPFNFDLGRGVRLAWATAQPVCALDEGNVRTVFFAETKGVPAQFAFDREGSDRMAHTVEPGRTVALKQPSAEGGEVHIVLLGEEDSLALWKGTWKGRDRVFLTRANLVIDGNMLGLAMTHPDELKVGIYPAPASVRADGKALAAEPDGVFACFAPPVPRVAASEVKFEQVRPAGPPRTIPMGQIRQAVAAAPVDADFEQAAIWRIELPAKLDMDADPILRLHYAGDVARVTLDGKLLTDDFYNGNALDIGLRRHAPEILQGELRVAILPLRRDAPIYMAKEARPDFGDAESLAVLERVEIVSRRPVQLTAGSVERKVRFVLVGDSTVTDHAGWGIGFKQLLGDRAECVNTSAGGRSSKSFIDEGRWEKALALKGAYYLIQFGHNDQPGKGPQRETDPDTTYTQFMSRYVDEARAIGARPVLVTSLTRRNFDKSGNGKIDSTLTPYVQAVKRLAQAKHVPLIDLHARSIALCEQLGREKTHAFDPIKEDGSADTTHLDAQGSVVFARLVVEELVRAVPELKPHFREDSEGAAAKVFDVRQFGAKGDGKTLDTEAIQKTLDECGQAGGGIVRFAPGTYLSQPIVLRTRTALQLDKGAILQATGNQVDFMKTPGDWLSARSGSDFVPFISGKDLTDIAITGAGTIDGNGQVWWAAAEEARRKKSGYTLPRPNLIILTRCKNVEITGVTIRNAPKFHLVPKDCEDVLIEDVTFKAPDHAPNTDAIDPSVSRRVRISRCVIDVGDDNVAIKSGKKMEGREFACEDITIVDCVFLHGHGVSIGSETVGGVRNVTVERCTFRGTENGIRIKSPRGKGGTIDGLRCRDITMVNVDPALTISAYYPKIPAEDETALITAETPIIKNIEITNLTATCPKEAGVIIGLPESLATNVSLTNVTISAQTGLTVRNARGVRLANVKIQTQEGPPVIVRNAEVEGSPAIE